MDTATFDTILVTADGPRGSLTLNRPDKLNPLSMHTLHEIELAARWFDEHHDLKVVVVTGAGKAFSAGADLTAFSGESKMEDRSVGWRMARAMDEMRAVTVARLHGWCVGGGLVVAAGCDLRVAAAPPADVAYRCAAAGGELRALPAVFSRDRLDGGSRLLLQVLPQLPAADRVIDLACGNGVLGLAALQQGLARQLLFADESAMAIASARANLVRLFPAALADCDFHHGDGLQDCAWGPAGLILCNPPFHLNHTVDAYAGRRLLAQCAHHLAPGGTLCLVANRHLDYGAALRRDFSPISKLVGDRRFTVWRACRA